MKIMEIQCLTVLGLVGVLTGNAMPGDTDLGQVNGNGTADMVTSQVGSPGAGEEVKEGSDGKPEAENTWGGGFGEIGRHLDVDINLD